MSFNFKIRAWAVATLGCLMSLTTSVTFAQMPNLDIPMYYVILQPTSGECIAKGSDGNVLRWKFEAKEEQKWLFAPAPGGWHIINAQNGEYMSVEGPGNVRTYRHKKGDTAQVFKIVPAGKGKINIREATRNEYVAIGGTGNVLRWARSDDGSQDFTLLPLPMPAAPTKANKPTATSAPKLAEFSDFKDKTPRTLVSEDIVSTAAIVDPDFGPTARIRQAKAHPYYVISREQYYKQGEVYSEDFSKDYEVREGFESEDFRSAGFTLNFDNTQTVKAGVTIKKVSVEASRSTTLKLGYEQLETHAQRRNSLTVKKVQMKRKDYNFPYQWAAYELVDVYTVTPVADGKRMSSRAWSWEVYNGGHTISRRKR